MSVTKRNLRPTVLSKNRKRAGARRRLHAVLVGINIYQDPRISNLQFAAADARTFHDALRRTLSAKELNTVLLMDAQATLSSVRRSIGEDLARAAERDDLVLLFFAGHGAPELDDLISPPNRYLIMNDTKYDQIFSTALDMEVELVRLLDRIRSRNVVVFIDSCFSGVAGGRTLEGPTLNRLRHEFRTSAFSLSELDFGEGRVLITACKDQELALEDPKLSHGVFTYCLLQTLLTDSPSSRIISLLTLYDEIATQVVRITNGEQNPVLKGSMTSQKMPYLKP